MKGKEPLTESQNNYERQVTDMFSATGFFILSKTLIKKLGFINAAVLASYLDGSTYWRNKKGSVYDGWFFKERTHIMNELEITLHVVRKAKKQLTQMGILIVETKKKSQREWIQIQFDCLCKLMLSDKGVVTPHPIPKKHIRVWSDLTPIETISNIKNKKKKINTKKKKQNDQTILHRKKLISPTPRGSSMQRDAEYMPLARRLLKIVKSTKKVHTTLPQLKGWSHHFRMLVEQNKVKWDRVEDALDWYANHSTDKYVPTIESGMTWRDKFVKIEDAMKRESDGGFVKKDVDNSRPEKIIKRRLNGLGKGLDIWMLKNVDEVLEMAPGLHDSTVTHNLIDLHDWIIKNRPASEKKLMAPAHIIQEYIWWYGQQAWIEDKSESAFKADGKLFNKFKNKASQEKGMDIITGLNLK